MSPDELYDHLISYATSSPQAKDAIEKLKTSERYMSDYKFRMMVDFSEMLNGTIKCEANERNLADRITRCVELMERATNLQMWQLVANAWLAMGNFYLRYLLFEKSLECFANGIRVEEEHGLYMLSPIMYLNMTLIFMEIEEQEKALNYVKKSEESLEKHADTIPRYWTKYISIQEAYLHIKVLNGIWDKEELKPHYDKIMQAPVDQTAFPHKVLIMSSKFNYGFVFFDREEHDRILMEIKELYGEQEYLIHLNICVDLSKRFGRDYHFYLERFKEYEKSDHLFINEVNAFIYKNLSEYYQLLGLEDKLNFTRAKQIEYCEMQLKEVLKQQSFAIHTIEELLMGEENKKKNYVENMEYKLIVNEAIETKRELEKAYERIAIIGELGKKLTATTDLNEVIGTILRVIKDHLKVDYFALMYYDEENRKLRSVAIYYNDELQENLVVDIDDEKSSSAKCFKTKEILKLYGSNHPSQRRVYFKGASEMLSCIFVPLVVAGNSIGVFSIQSAEEKAYEGDSFAFLKEIEPYLSNALNNAVKSWLIEKESEERRKIQKELEEANAILSKLSSMDGLTQINSRRAFEERFKECILHTKRERTSLCVFMMDIDYFKLYNDTYGHLQGDEVLKTVAKIFRTQLKEVRGLSARFGGEEFIGAVSGLSEEEAIQVAQNICREIVSAKIEHSASPLGMVTASIGVSITKQVTQEVEHDIRSKLMKLADECLYEAKASGKNTSVIRQIPFE